jgi:glycosyltransferase involved in cell wall biosynthesis
MSGGGKPAAGDAAEFPRVNALRPDAEIVAGMASVVIPACNEARWIGATLAAVFRQTDPGADFEVIVVDTGSTDATRDLAREQPVQVLETPVRSSYVARNLGIAAARGEFLVFLDADCIPEPGWLQALVRAARSDGDYVAGRIENDVVVNNLANRILAHRTSANARRRNSEAGGVAAGNMLVHRKVFQQFGLFPEVQSGGDVFLSRRAAEAGVRLAYAAEAVVRHQCDLDNLDYLRRRFRIRRGQARLLRNTGAARAVLASFPWRPGWSQSGRMARATETPRLPMFVFLWLERLMEFCGSLLGTMERNASEEPPTTARGGVS